MSEELFRIKWGPPEVWYLDADVEEPQDLYPFKISSLPSELAEEAEQERLAGEPFSLTTLIERGVESVYWRQPPRQILQSQSATTAVFDALTPLTGGRILPRGKIAIAGSFLDGYQPYHLVSHRAWDEDPLYFSAELPRTPELQDLVEDRTDLGLRRRLAALRKDGVATTVWLPNSLLQQPQAMALAMNGPSGVLVNAKFVDAWRQTEISQHLRDQPWEFDLHFEPLKLEGHEYGFFDE